MAAAYDRNILSVLLGLAAGIGFLVLFMMILNYSWNDAPSSSLIGSATRILTITSEQQHQEQQQVVDRVVNESREARAFLAKYPLARVGIRETVLTICNDCNGKSSFGELVDVPVTKVTFTAHTRMSFPGGEFHQLILRVDVNSTYYHYSNNSIAHIALLCSTFYEHDGAMSTELAGINALPDAILRNPNWLNRCH